MKPFLLFISATLAIFGLGDFIYILANNQCTNQYIFLLLGSICGATLFLFLSNFKKKAGKKDKEKTRKTFPDSKNPQPRYQPVLIKRYP